MDRKLFEAASAGSVDFLRRAAQLQPNDLLKVTVGGNSVLHIAAKLGHPDVASLVRTLQPSLLKLRNLSGDTPLHCAAAAGHVELVKLFLQSSWYAEPHIRLEVLRRKNSVGDTALHGAARNGHVAVVAPLMETDHELAATVNDAGVSALYMAAERGSVEIARILLQYPMTSHQGPHGQVALHATVLRSCEITEMILKKGVDHLSCRDSNGSTPLHFATANGDLRMMQMLLENDASIAYLQDQEGFSAIHVAANEGHTKIVNEILLRCPDSMEQKNSKGRNFLHTAIMNTNLEIVNYKAIAKNYLEMVKYVLKLKTPLLKELVNEQDDEGNTPLHLAVKSRDKKIILALLSSRIVDAGVMNNSGKTPLDLAYSDAETAFEIRMYHITVDLLHHGSRFSPQRVDYMRNNLLRKKDEEINRYRASAKNLGIIAVLIATVALAAPFTFPGEYKNDSGNDARLSVPRSTIFNAFLIFDTLAMASSITVSVILVHVNSMDQDVRSHFLSIARGVLLVAMYCMTLTFATVYIFVAHGCFWVVFCVSQTACIPVAVFYVSGRSNLRIADVLRRPHVIKYSPLDKSFLLSLFSLLYDNYLKYKG